MPWTKYDNIPRTPAILAIVELSHIHPTGYEIPTTRLVQILNPDLDFSLEDFDSATKIVANEFWRGEQAKMQNPAPQLAGDVYTETQPIDNSPSGLEAKIRMMKCDAVVALATAKGIQFDPHAPNNGVLSMRVKNALYHAIRRGELHDVNH